MNRRKLSNWSREALYDILSYKAKRFGIKIIRVNPRWTSTYCPRCGAKGEKIRDLRTRKAIKRGRFFYCDACTYLADRDYIAAVNIYRKYQELRKNALIKNRKKSLSFLLADAKYFL